jgi:hypothetical protein
MGVGVCDEIGICSLLTNRLNRSHVLIARSERVACEGERISFDAQTRDVFFSVSSEQTSEMIAVCHHECDPARFSTLYKPCCRGRQCYTSVAFRHRVVESVGRRLSAAFHFPWAVPTRRCECVMSAAMLHCFDHARISCLGKVFLITTR